MHLFSFKEPQVPYREVFLTELTVLIGTYALEMFATLLPPKMLVNLRYCQICK